MLFRLLEIIKIL